MRKSKILNSWMSWESAKGWKWKTPWHHFLMTAELFRVRVIYVAHTPVPQPSAFGHSAKPRVSTPNWRRKSTTAQ